EPEQTEIDRDAEHDQPFARRVILLILEKDTERIVDDAREQQKKDEAPVPPRVKDDARKQHHPQPHAAAGRPIEQQEDGQKNEKCEAIEEHRSRHFTIAACRGCCSFFSSPFPPPRNAPSRSKCMSSKSECRRPRQQVDDLTAADFEVSVNGKPALVTNFYLVKRGTRAVCTIGKECVATQAPFPATMKTITS